ncbi:uncharacterized protein LOC122633550 isoform X1 [Vespula pensylvanica]|uniref:uncharacterized protein LOC122633550 isoform X1 n=1 Tax=Vespula pensylvanica TaxID=30213 RepID=UPI001CBA0525|nr:uncharacterized protein LOC122633550 isoform X1 [Vespula pensylvanica]
MASSSNDAETSERYRLDGNITVSRRTETALDVFCITYTETFEFLAAGLSDGTVQLYKTENGVKAKFLRDNEIVQNPGTVTAIKHRPVRNTHPITHTLIATYIDGYIKSWHYPSSQCLYTIRENRQILGLAYHPNEPKFVTVGDDTNIYLYNEETKVQERVFHARYPFVPTSRFFWKTERKKKKRKYLKEFIFVSEIAERMDGHKSRVFAACFNPKSAHEIISGGWDDTIMFWDTRQPYALRYISGVHICGDGIDISQNGKEHVNHVQILTCAWQKKDPIQLWDYGSGKLITSLEPDNVPSMLYCGKYLSNIFITCGGTDMNLLRIVDLRSHSTLAMVRNLVGGVHGIALGPVDTKRAKKSRQPEMYLPKIAFCSNKMILEVQIKS